MNRREVLRLTAGVGALAVAGCTGGDDTASPADGTDTDPDGAGGNGGGDEGADTPAVAIADTTVQTAGKECLSGDQTTDISFESGADRVVLTGIIRAPTPCHDAILRSAEYDAGADRLVVDIGTEDDGSDTCVECVGGIGYEVTVEFSGGLPQEATVAHDGQSLASAAYGSSSASGPEDGAGGDNTSDGSSGSSGGEDTGTDSPPTLEASSLSVTDISSSATETTAGIDFRTDAGEVVVRGTIEGEDGCATAALGDVRYDAAADAVSVSVVTEPREGSEDQACTSQVVYIDYEAVIEFSGGVPHEASVSHNGRGIGAAAYGSASAGDGS